jgi:excisionase family DNA binding protein
MEAARILRVSTQTIRNYIYSGRIKSFRTPGGHHRVSRDDLQKLGFLKKS